MKTPHRRKIALLAIIGMVGAVLAPVATPVEAAGLAQVMVRLDRMTTSTDTGGRICATPGTVASTEATVQVTFPTGFTVDSTASNWTVNTTGLDTGQTAWPGIATASNVTGQTVTFASSDLASGSTLYCFNFSATNTLTTPSGTNNNLFGTVTTQTSGPATIDSSQYATAIISNDQIVVTAAVGATFTFALSGNTDSFGGNLDTALVNTTAGRTVTLTTNAAQGWIVWAKDSQNDGSGNGSLYSSAAGKYIAGVDSPGTAARTFNSGSEDYGLGVTVDTDATGGGTVALDAAYDGGAGSNGGTLDPTAYRQLASADGTAAGDIINLVELATISTGTPAASDYTDTITVVGAGQF